MKGLLGHRRKMLVEAAEPVMSKTRTTQCRRSGAPSGSPPHIPIPFPANPIRQPKQLPPLGNDYPDFWGMQCLELFSLRPLLTHCTVTGENEMNYTSLVFKHFSAPELHT